MVSTHSTPLIPTIVTSTKSQATMLSKSALVAIGALFLSAMAQISIPIPGSPVPVTGQTLAALLIGTSYGLALGTSSFLLYLLVGFVGLPVFADGSHGISRLTGATGGYLVGMLLATALTGYLAERKWDQRFRTSIPTMLLGSVVIFGSGMFWLHHVAAESWSWTLSKGFTPFIPGEIIKIAIASTSLPVVWRYLHSKDRTDR